MSRPFAIAAVSVVSAFLPQAWGQSVISARSGLINYFEGVAFVDAAPLAHKSGIFARLHEGDTLSTESGRAEVLLTPDTYLRIGADSSIRMIKTDMDDTQVELLSGSAILDSAQAPAGAFVKIIFRDETIRPMKPGNYRIDAEQAQLRVFAGEAEVSRGKEDPVTVLSSQLMPLDGSSVVKRFTEGADGLLDIWSDERGALIASNLANSQSISDPLLDTGPAVPADLAAYIGWLPPMPPASGGTYDSVYPTYPGYGYPGYGYPGYGYPGYPGYPGYAPYGALSLLIPAYRPATSLWIAPRTAGYSSIYTVRPGYTGSVGSYSSRPTYVSRPVITAPRTVGGVGHVGGRR